MELPDKLHQNRVILVVANDAAIYSLIQDALLAGKAGCSVIRMNGEELAGMLAAKTSARKPGMAQASAIILDDDCLGKWSTQALSLLKTNELLAYVPVVMLVGSENTCRISEYQTMGASICIMRSDSPEAMTDTIARLGGFLSVVQVSKR